MAEEEQKEIKEVLDICGDDGLEEIIKRHFKSVSTDISGGKVTLRGKVKHVQKVKTCFVPFNIDNYRRQFIITEDYPLQYLNQNLGDEACYFTKSKASVSLFIPHNRRQGCKEEMMKLVGDRIVVQKYDCNESTTNKKLVENLLFEHFGKIIVVGDAIVYTKDIEAKIKAATNKKLDVPESQGAGVSDVIGYVVDDSCLDFIRKHFRNTEMSITKSRTDIHLSWGKSDFTTDPIKVLDLKLDKRKEQLILTERNARQYIHRKFGSRNTVCILAVHISKIYGLVPPNCHNVERVLENVNRVIEESICFKQLDYNDDLSSFNGKCTSLIQDGDPFLVFTDDVRDGVEEMFMRKQGHKDGPNQTSHKANYPKLDKGQMLHQNVTRDRHSSDGKGVLHDSNGRLNKEPDENSSLGSFENNYQETNSYSDNEEELNKGFMASGASNYSELESSFEHMTNLELDTDLSEYIFDSEKFRVKDISSQLGCMIEKENGHIVIGGKNGRKLAEDIYKKAETVAMMSTYIEKNKLDKCSTHSFKELIQKLRMDGSKVALHSCENCRVEYSMVYKGAKVFLIHGSAADIPQTDVLVCPLDSRLNPACASAKHIMTKGGVALRKECLQIATDVTNQQKAFSDFHVQDFQNTGELPAKKLCGIVINQSFRDTDTFQRQMASKLKGIFGNMIQKQCFSYTFPLEVGNKISPAVMARACCVALRELMAGKSSNVKEVFLCVVNEAHLAPVKALIETELRISRDPQRMQANGSLEQCLRKTEIYELTSINVRLVTGSLVDQEVDAIVVPVNSQLELGYGVISKSVLNAAGKSIQDELKGKLPQGIGPMEVAFTGPGKLNLLYILYGNLPTLKSRYGSPASRVNILMKNIFQLVHDLKIRSITLPALGTGGLNYQDETVAMEIMRAIYLYGPKSGIRDIRVVIYNKMSPQYRIFKKAVEEFQDGVKLTSKACLLHPSIEICHEKTNQVFKVTVNGAEQRICDVEIVNRKAGHVDSKDKTPTDSICVKTLEQMSMGLMRHRICIDVSDARFESTKVDEILGQGLDIAIKQCEARFLLINVGRCDPADEAKVIIKRYLKTIMNKLRKEDAVQIHFLVSVESLNACVAYVKEREEKKTSSGWTRRLHGFLKNSEFKWRVVESRIRSQGAYLVLCSSDETRLQRALLEINHHINNDEEDAQARPDYDRLDSKRSSNMSLETANEDLRRLDSKQLSRSSSASSDNTSNFRDRGSQQDLPMKESNNTGSLRDVRTKDKDVGDLDTQSQLSHKEKKIPYEDTTMVLSKSRLRHLPRKPLEKLKNSLKKIAQCECKGDDIKIKIPYEERHKLLDVLEEPLRGIDKKVYFVRNVTPAILHLLELHMHVEPNFWVYHEHDEELKIRNYEDIYDEAEEKKKLFGSYQMDTIDVSTNNHLVPGAIQEIHGKKDEKFQNILLEAVNENKVINIHYPVEEQNVVTEMKTLLQVRLKLIKQTGRRKRTFDNYTSLQPNFATSFSPALDLDTQRDTTSVSKNSTHKQHENTHVQKSPTQDSVRFTTSTRLSTHLSTYHSMPAYQRSVSVNIPRRTDTDISPDIVAETVYLTAKKMKIRVYKGDILNLNVDCIVNAANEQLMHGGGVAAVIARAAGREFQTESKRYIDDNGPLEVGECVCTGAGRLRYKYVLHAVGPQWGMYKDKVDCEDDLRKTIVNILKLTEALKLKSVAIPAISSGIFGVPWDVCAQQYAGGLTSYEDESLGTIEEVHFIDIKEDILNEIRNVFNTEFQLQTFNMDEIF